MTAGAIAWVLIEIAFAIHGFPAVPRYMFEPGAIGAVLAGVFAGWVVLELPGLLAPFARRLQNSGLRPAAAGRIGAWAAVLVVLVFAGSMLPDARKQLRLERSDLTAQHVRTKQINQLSTVVRRLGAANILACGQPNIPIAFQSQLAWYLDIKVGELYVNQAAIARNPHPLVNMYPIHDGWKVFASHVTPASAARCNKLLLFFRS